MSVKIMVDVDVLEELLNRSDLVDIGKGQLEQTLRADIARARASK